MVSALCLSSPLKESLIGGQDGAYLQRALLFVTSQVIGPFLLSTTFFQSACSQSGLAWFGSDCLERAESMFFFNFSKLWFDL